MSVIRIKRSGTSGAPTTLSPGELAYSWYDAGDSNQTSGGLRLYAGTGVDANTGLAASIDVIGGEYFTTKLDHTPGVLVANSAIITAANNAIDQLIIDTIHIDGSTIGINANTTYAAANTNLTIQAGASGEIVLASDTRFSGTVDFDGNVTVASLNVEDLTDDRIVIAGASGELEDDGNFTFDGTTFTVGNTSVNATITVASGNFETDGTIGADGNLRIGASGANNLTVDSTNGDLVTEGDITGKIDATFGATGQLAFANANSTVTLTGNMDINGVFDADNINIDGNTISSTDTDGNILLDPDGDGYVQAVGTNGFVIPVGNTAQQGPAVGGAIRFNSEINQFEGYSGTNWSSLGGVRSVDGLTYIIAESSPGASDDILHFYAATSNTTTNEVAQLDDVSLRILNGTSSSNTTTGSLVVTGGAGISENLNVGGDVDISGDVNVEGGDITTTQTTFNLLNTGATTVNAFGAATAVNIGTGGEGGGLTTIGHDLDVTGDLEIGTAAFTVDAGTGDVLVGRDLTVTGDLTVNGNTTTINVSTLQVEDALIFLAANNTTADSVDIGFAGNYYDGSTIMLTGLFRDSGTDEWYLFDEYNDAVNNTENNNIDISSNTFSKGVLNTDKIAFSNTTIELTGDVAGDVTIDHFGGGDGVTNTVITIATTVQADSVALGNDTTGDYVATASEAVSVDGTTAGSNNQIAVHLTGTGEGAALTIAAVIADHSGQLGVATFDALSNGAGSPRNFDVSAAGSVSINTIDGGTY